MIDAQHRFSRTAEAIADAVDFAQSNGDLEMAERLTAIAAALSASGSEHGRAGSAEYTGV